MAPGETDSLLKSFSQDERSTPTGFSASVFVNEHLTLGLTGLVPFYLCCFSAIAIVNNYVDTRGPKMEHVRMWLAILVCTGGVVCGLGVYYWFRWVREQQADRVQTRTKDPEAAPSTNPTELLPYSVSHGTLGEPAPADPNVSPKVPTLTDAGQKVRINQIDTMKTIVIINVVFLHSFMCRGGHFNNRKFMSAYNFIVEPVIMPAMAWASGFVYSAVATSGRTRANLQLLAGYFIWQGVYLLLLKFHVYEDPPTFGTRVCFSADVSKDDKANPLNWEAILNNLLSPFYHMWYLWALVVWRFIIPHWMQLRHPVVSSIVLASIGLYIRTDRTVLAFQRVLGYFPYFVIGVTMKADGHSKLLLQFVSKRRSKVWAVVMMGVHILSMAYASLDRMCLESVMFSSNIHQSTCMRGWHVLRYPYSWESDQWASGFWLFPLSRVPAIALNMVASLAFLTLMPASENILRRAGERSLCPYVCHLLMLMFLHVNTDLVEDLEWKHVVPTFLVMGGWTLFLFLPITYDFLLNTLIPPLNKSRFVFSDKTA